MSNKLEILAPAGNREMLGAAVFSGADAVYLGLTGFNARRTAGNPAAKIVQFAIKMKCRKLNSLPLGCVGRRLSGRKPVTGF